jgi:hypothetical protein
MFISGVYTCVTREGQSTSTTIRTARERTPRSEERFGSYMKIDSPRTSRTPELGGYRSSMSPTANRYVPSLDTGDDERQQSPRVEETRRTKKITIQETSEQRLPTATKTSKTKIFKIPKKKYFISQVQQHFVQVQVPVLNENIFVVVTHQVQVLNENVYQCHVIFLHLQHINQPINYKTLVIILIVIRNLHHHHQHVKQVLHLQI